MEKQGVKATKLGENGWQSNHKGLSLNDLLGLGFRRKGVFVIA